MALHLLRVNVEGVDRAHFLIGPHHLALYRPLLRCKAALLERPHFVSDFYRLIGAFLHALVRASFAATDPMLLLKLHFATVAHVSAQSDVEVGLSVGALLLLGDQGEHALTIVLRAEAIYDIDILLVLQRIFYFVFDAKMLHNALSLLKNDPIRTKNTETAIVVDQTLVFFTVEQGVQRALFEAAQGHFFVSDSIFSGFEKKWEFEEIDSLLHVVVVV